VSSEADSLQELADFLLGHGQAELGARASRNAQALRDGDRHGATDHLEWNRAYTDVYFSPVNGNAPDEATAETLNTRYRALSSAAFTAAEGTRSSALDDEGLEP